MRILLTGASGLIGSAVAARLAGGGDVVIPAVRRAPRPDETGWDPASGRLDPEPAVDAVVHLAGASLAGERWSAAYKRQVRASRVEATLALSHGLAAMSRPPAVLVTASAVGIYGDRGAERLTEESAPGQGFLADLARAWEAATAPVRSVGVRVVHLRFGLVLDPRGGALAALLPLARLGLGGPLGSGRQFWSWITLEDVTRALGHCLTDASVAGPCNVVAPAPVTQRDFAATLGRVLGRPAFLPAPAPALRLILGEMADEMLLASQRVFPERLTRSGFTWRDPELGAALRAVLGRPADG